MSPARDISPSFPQIEGKTMTKQLMLYSRVVPISQDRHAETSVQTGKDWRFAADLHTAPVLVAEIEPASAEMPIVFAGEGDAIAPVALLAVRAGENAFVSAEGKWTGSYIPAFFRRYPFVFAETGADKQTLTLCIDEDHAGVNTEGRGERLFDSTGERTQYLSNMLKFVTDFETQHSLTREFCKRLVALKLLEPAVATVTLPDKQTLTVTGFHRVNRDKLRELDDTTVVELFRNDMLGLIHTHLASLAHLATLANKAGPASETPTPPAPELEAEDATPETTH